MDATTISFDYDANPPSVSLPIEQQQSSPPQRVVTPYRDFHMLNDSTSSASMVFISPNRDEDILCGPLMTTPEPSMSPCVFDSELLPTSFALSPLPSNEHSEYSNCVNSPTTNYESYFQTSTPLSLLPQLSPPIPNHIDYDNGIIMEQDLLPLGSIQYTLRSTSR